ncbi:MAG: T9SS type A sorting domain-containing protein [Saprospiraceae bacterium]|nr:T9SS type A sorting domain-containing protein [Saprospiraceae bacterium]
MLDVRSYKNETEVINLQRYTSADSLRYITPLHITPLVNGKLLVFVKEGSYYVDTFKFVTLDNDAFALSYMLLDEKDLGITSGTNGYSTNSNDGLEFFPNPVTDALTIRFATPYKGLISLSDISGRTVMVRDVTDLSEEVNIDMSYLASGIYIIRLPQHISGRSYKVVKM